MGFDLIARIQSSAYCNYGAFNIIAGFIKEVFRANIYVWTLQL